MITKAQMIHLAIKYGRFTIRTCLAIEDTKNIKLLKKILNNNPPANSTCDYSLLKELANNRMIQLGYFV